MLRQFHRTVLEKREIVCVCCKSYFLFIEMEWFFNVKKFYGFLYSWGNKIIQQFYLLWKTTKTILHCKREYQSHSSGSRYFSLPECSYLCLARELCLEKTLAHWSHAYIPSSASILCPFQLLRFFFRGLSSSSNESSRSICTSSASICQQIITISFIIIYSFFHYQNVLIHA